MTKPTNRTLVYVVMAGTYSGYHVAGVFSTYEKALAYGKTYDDSAHVDVWQTDNPNGETAGCFVAYMAARDGLTMACVPAYYRGTRWEWTPSKRFKRYDVMYTGLYAQQPPQTPAGFSHSYTDPHGLVAGYGATEEHAIRSASNFIRNALADGELTDG